MTERDETQRGKARVIEPVRNQPSWDILDLDAWLPADHPARLVWSFVETLDLSALYELILSREGSAGRPAADPRVLFALWLLATLDGVGSARLLERMCERDLAYRWLAGGVPVNYHGLADFRVAHAALLDRLLTQSLAAFMAEGLVSCDEIIVDGTKVKASAGAGSDKRRQRLDELEAAASERIEALKKEVEANPAACSRRQQAARERAVRERIERVRQAKATLDAIEKERAKAAEHDAKSEADKKAPRASLADSEARRMRFADGAVRAGYNIQVAATSGEGFVTAIRVTDRRSDKGLASPMLEEAEKRLGCKVKRLLVDGGYASHDDLVALAGREAAPVTVYMPPPEDRQDIKPTSLARRERKRAKEPEAVKAWRERMQGEEAKEIMKGRWRIELVNAHKKARGLGVMLVRGLEKVQAMALWHAVAHNLATALRLRAERMQAAKAA